MPPQTQIQQLLNMGFAADMAAEALAAADGDLLKATDWLLNHSSPKSPQSISPSQSQSQSKINRFFSFHPKKDANPSDPQSQIEAIDEPHQKRQKISVNRENHPSAAAPPPPLPSHAPLAERMRPRVLDEVVGQDHLLARDSLLRSAISSNRLPSVVLWGPPGAGKTSIAKAIVTSCDAGNRHRFVALSAVTCGVKDIRDTVDEALKLKNRANRRTVLFLDEVHRFNKAQQDSFLPIIEDGTIIFIGATTENPSFHLITPLLSRCRVLMLNPLKPEHITTILNRALNDEQRGLSSTFDKALKFQLPDDSIDFLSSHCDGDARVALNALEVAATTAASRAKSSESVIIIDVHDVKEALQCKHLAYDRAGEEHYNIISAVHKSMRGGDADAAIYWLARMLEGGEDPLYVARRLIRFASEDVGLADPQALTQAVSCYQACHFIGMPECNVVLAQCVAYLALAPKSVAVYRAIQDAQKMVKMSVGQNERVPLHLRNGVTKVMKDAGYGKGYVYPPDDPEGAGSQTYLPPSLEGHKFLRWP